MSKRRIACLLLTVLSLVPLAAPHSARAISSADAFAATWARSDAPVASGAVARTWMWGPQPLGAPVQEPYAEAPRGMRAVVYYDKSRMEVTRPDGDPASPWYVTNGLLALELITGEMQVGDEEWEPRLPAEINIVGDQGFPNGPTYAAFQRFLIVGEHNSLPAQREGSLVRERMDAAGRVVVDERFAAYDVHATQQVSGSIRTIAAPFWAFMTSRGTVQIDGALAEDTLFPTPVYATGLPITEPYWAEVVVGGTPKDVLLQCFERRCLTYTPGNPPGWQVESGNIGQHYQQWRNARPPHVDGELLFTRHHIDAEGNVCVNMYLINIDGSNERRLIPEFTCNVGDPQWSPQGDRILFSSDNDLFILRMATMDLLRLTETPEGEWAASWSPDGTQIAVLRDGGDPDPRPNQLILLQADGSGEQVLTHDIQPGAWLQAALWSPDGDSLAYLRSDAIGGWIEDDTESSVVVLDVATGVERVVWSVRGTALGELAWMQDSRELLVRYSWRSPDGRPIYADEDWTGGAVVGVNLSAESAQPELCLISGCIPWRAAHLCAGGEDGTIWFTALMTRASDGSGALAMLATPMLDVPEPRTWRVLGASGLAVLDPVSGAWAQLTHYLGTFPEWSPDGQFILFEVFSHTGYRPPQRLIAITSRDGHAQWIVPVSAEIRVQWRPTPAPAPVTNP